MNFQFRNKNVLLISPETWDHIHVSKHHYAIHLGRMGNRVFFLNPPGTRQDIEATDHTNVTSVHYTGFPKGLRFYPRPLQRYFIGRKFRELEAMCGTPFDVVWSFDNSVFFDFSALPASIVTISHIVDATQDFQTERAAATALLCLGSTHFIVERLKRSNLNSFFVQHGYAQRDDHTAIELPGRHAVRAGYSGNLNLCYIDWDTLDKLTSNHPEVGFYFAGPYHAEHEKIRIVREKSNVYFVGPLPSHQLDSFYKQMNVLLLCYLADDYTEQLANPHKTMEYLGSGIPIVATFTAEYRDLSDRGLLAMTNTNNEFLSKFSSVLNDLTAWHTIENRKLREEVALDNTYDKQIERIAQYINECQTKSIPKVRK